MIKILVNIFIVLGESEFVEWYYGEYVEFFLEFKKEWVSVEGDIIVCLQIVYVFVIEFGFFVDVELQMKVERIFRIIIVEDKYYVGIGFVGMFKLGFVFECINVVEDFYVMFM